MFSQSYLSYLNLRKSLTRKILLFFVFLVLSLYALRHFNSLREYYYSLPVEFSYNSKIPLTRVKIEGKQFLLELDLGSKTSLSLTSDALKTISKELNGVARRIDFRGNKYETPLYTIANASLGDFINFTVDTKQESEEFVNNGSIVSGYASDADIQIARLISGRVGRNFFKGKNIYMNFSSNEFILCKSIKNRNKMTQIPFELTNDGIVFEIETDRGLQKFVLDSGSTLTILHAHSEIDRSLEKKRYGLPTYSSTKFAFNGIDFGPHDLFVLEVSEAFREVDGFLGMDFLSKHALFLDFEKKMAYICKHIPKQPEESGIWLGSSSKFSSGANDHCREARHE